MSEVYRTPPVPCPACGYLLDAAGAAPDTRGAGERGPQAGDVTMCFNCMVTLMFVGGLGYLSVRLAANDELDEEDHRIIAAMRETIRRVTR